MILIAAILAVVAIPRFTRGGFDEAQLYDETVAALHYAQRTAVAYQRTVCATFSGNNQLALTYAATYGSATCNTNLVPPGGSGTSYVVNAPGSATYTSASNFSFDLLGKPSMSQTIALSGGRTITVESETGYVH